MSAAFQKQSADSVAECCFARTAVVATLVGMTEDELLDVLTDAGLMRSADGMWLDATCAVGAVPTGTGAFCGWVDVMWTGPANPVRHLQGVTHVPRGLEAEVRTAIERAEVLREAALRRCRHCGQQYIPGHMHSKDVCQSCAERHLGVVY